RSACCCDCRSCAAASPCGYCRTRGSGSTEFGTAGTPGWDLTSSPGPVYDSGRRIIDGEIGAKPLILLTNDDGIYAQGILAAWQELRKIGEGEVVAPDAERSAVGHAITLLLPLRTKEVVRRNVRFGYAVNGMPAD